MCFSVKIERNINKLAKELALPIDTNYLEKVVSASKTNPKFYKLPDENDRIYPGYFSPVIISTKHGPLITVMRYRLTPHFSDGPDYCNIDRKTGKKKILPTYNARTDSLKTRKAWKNIYETNQLSFP